MDRRWIWAVLCVAAAACGNGIGHGGPGSARDAGADAPATDAPPGDVGPRDAATEQGATSDAGGADGMANDAGARDSTTEGGPADAGTADASAGDATTNDAATAEGGPGDAGTADASAGDAAPTDAAPNDAATDATPSDAGPESSALCDGAPCTVANGTCTYREVSRFLSCPAGMSCECYDSPSVLFSKSPSTLELSIGANSIGVVGGYIPPNKDMSPPRPATITLSPPGTSPRTGSSGPYQASVTASTTTITVWMNEGYVPQSSVLYTSADCGYGGNELTCTFQAP